MPRRALPKFGPVNEREFPAPRMDSWIRDLLKDFKGRGLICDYSHTAGMLTVWRPWIDGQTQDEVFGGLSRKERISHSRQLFRLVHDKLDEVEQGHGALHPRNIILRQGGGIELVDAIFNRAYIGSHALPQDDLWLWGPCVAAGWEMDKWDQVSLLRTAALLAQGPAVWGKRLSHEEVADMCRGWAENLLASAPPSADFKTKVCDAVELLPRILEASFSPRTDVLAGSFVPLSQDEGELAEVVTPGENDEQLRKRIRGLLRYAGRAVAKKRPDEALAYIDEIFN